MRDGRHRASTRPPPGSHDGVDLAADVTLLPGTSLQGATSVATGATIGPDTTLIDVEVGEGARVVRTHGDAGRDRRRTPTVGPFALPASRHRAGRPGQDRHLRRDQERDHRRRREGAAPHLLRRRRGRRRRQHRRRHDLRQLRRGHQARTDGRDALLRRQRLGARRAGRRSPTAPTWPPARRSPTTSGRASWRWPAASSATSRAGSPRKRAGTEDRAAAAEAALAAERQRASRRTGQ